MATSGDGGDSGGGKTIALLLPESKTTRYEAFDKPLFEAAVADLCDDCTVDYYNADQDEAKQAQQMTTALNAGASVVVLDPVNGAGATGMVEEAQGQDVPVIAYDRFIDERRLLHVVRQRDRRHAAGRGPRRGDGRRRAPS